MIESVVALLMFVNGSINEARIQESMATCFPVTIMISFLIDFDPSIFVSSSAEPV